MDNIQIIEELFIVVSLLEKTGNRIFSQAKLTTNMAAVLFCVQSGHDTNRDLCTFLEGSPSAIAQKVAALEKRGLMRRLVDAEDKRSWRFSLTPEGDKALSDCMPRYKKATDTLFAEVSAEERQQTVSMLENIKHRLLLAHNDPKWFDSIL